MCLRTPKVTQKAAGRFHGGYGVAEVIGDCFPELGANPEGCRSHGRSSSLQQPAN